MKRAGLETLLINLGLICKLCSQEKAVIVDRVHGTVPMNTLNSEGKVVIKHFFPSTHHHSYCSYHLRLKGD